MARGSLDGGSYSKGAPFSPNKERVFTWQSANENETHSKEKMIHSELDRSQRLMN